MNLDFIKCLNRCRIHRREDEFKHFLLDGYENPDFIELKERGTKYPGRVVYHIHEFGCSNGFFSEFIFLLKKLLYSDARGFVPFADWGKDYLYYEPDGVNGEKNGFLYYFAPLSDVTDADEACFAVDSVDAHLEWVYDTYHAKAYSYPPEYISELAAMARKYVAYNNSVKEYLEKEYDSLLGNARTLAVHFRGTDYRRQYNNHPVFVTAQEEINKARELMEKGNYEQIFLATDEEDAVKQFSEEFGDKLKFFTDVNRASDGDESVAFSRDERKLHHYRLGLEVLRDQYVLTRCDGLVCGISNLTVAARILREAWYDEGYSDLCVIEHGFNHNDNRFISASH